MNTPDTAARGTDETLTLGELLGDEVLAGAELIAGRAGLDRTIIAVNVMTVPDIDRWVRQDEFLLATGYPLPRDDENQGRLLTDLHRLGLAGIGIKLDRYMPRLGQAMIDVAERLGLPLVVIPERIRFDDILTKAYAIIVNRQASALARAQEIHHSFLAITLSGGGLTELASSLSGLLGEASVVITDPQGTVLALAGDEAPLVELDFLRAASADRAARRTRSAPACWPWRPSPAARRRHPAGHRVTRPGKRSRLPAWRQSRSLTSRCRAGHRAARESAPTQPSRVSCHWRHAPSRPTCARTGRATAQRSTTARVSRQEARWASTGH